MARDGCQGDHWKRAGKGGTGSVLEGVKTQNMSGRSDKSRGLQSA